VGITPLFWALNAATAVWTVATSAWQPAAICPGAARVTPLEVIVTKRTAFVSPVSVHLNFVPWIQWLGITQCMPCGSLYFFSLKSASTSFWNVFWDGADGGDELAKATLDSGSALRPTTDTESTVERRRTR
jgi:hypothetical protein